jgi:hypothetical protein
VELDLISKPDEENDSEKSLKTRKIIISVYTGLFVVYSTFINTWLSVLDYTKSPLSDAPDKANELAKWENILNYQASAFVILAVSLFIVNAALIYMLKKHSTDEK